MYIETIAGESYGARNSFETSPSTKRDAAESTRKRRVTIFARLKYANAFKCL